MALPSIGGTREWLGRIFFLLAIGWFGAVFWVMRPDKVHFDPKPAPVVMMPDGKNHRVYLPYEIFGEKAGWAEPVDVKTEYTFQDFLRRPMFRFLIVALGPPAAVLFGSLAGLAISVWLNRNSRSL
jgi:hypothetical protein